MTANNINSLNPAIPGYSIRWHALGGVVLIAAIAFGTAIIVSHFRGWALDTSGRELEKTTLLLARHFDQQFREFGVVQNELVVYMRSTGIASNEAYKRQMSSQGTHEMLQIMSNGSADVAGVNIFDSDVRPLSGRHPIGPTDDLIGYGTIASWRRSMSARGQKHRSDHRPVTSGLTRQADVIRVCRHVSNVPRVRRRAIAGSI
jgi:hypothetical protein